MNRPHGEQRLESWRVLILRRDAEQRILLRPEGTRFALPQILIPAGERIAANINCAVERDLGIPVVSLYEVFPENQDQRTGDFYHAAVAVRPNERVPAGAYWTRIRSLTVNSFLRQKEFAAVIALKSRLESRTKSGTPEPFLKPDWFVEVTSWIAQSLGAHGLRLSGQFRQLNASPTFSLIRFETDRKPVWFKAVGEPNTREFGLTLALSQLCPEYVPKILAVNTEWTAWLAEEASGPSLSASAEIRQWEQTAESLAHLQTLTIPAVADLFRAGARNLHPAHLLPRVAPFLEFVAERRSQQDSPSVQELSGLDLHQLRAAIHQALTELHRLDLPETLGNMDLNPLNIFSSDHGSIFLDWAEGFTGCPFFSFEYLLQHFRRSLPSETSLEARFRDAYLRRWRQLLSERDLERALVLSPLAALFAYASTLWSSLTKQGSMTALQESYLLRLARKMRRMTLQAKGVGA